VAPTGDPGSNPAIAEGTTSGTDDRFGSTTGLCADGCFHWNGRGSAASTFHQDYRLVDLKFGSDVDRAVGSLLNDWR